MVVMMIAILLAVGVFQSRRWAANRQVSAGIRQIFVLNHSLNQYAMTCGGYPAPGEDLNEIVTGTPRIYPQSLLYSSTDPDGRCQGADNGLLGYTLPLAVEKFAAKPVKSLSVKIEFDGKQPLKNLYSPSHKVEIRRDGDRRATVGYEASDVTPESDFQLLYALESRDVGLNLLTYRTGSDDGFFVLLATPAFELNKKQVVLKDVAFVLDTSGVLDSVNKREADYSPVASLNQLTLYFTSNRSGGAGNLDVWTATRGSMSQAFGAAVNVGELATSENELPNWLSDDECRLYLNRAGDLYVATKP